MLSRVRRVFEPSHCEHDQATLLAAFNADEHARRVRVERIVAQGARSSSSKVPGVLGRLARDAMLRLMLRFVVTETSLAWMYDYRVDWPTAVVAHAVAQ